MMMRPFSPACPACCAPPAIRRAYIRRRKPFWLKWLELQAALNRQHPELPVIFMTAFPEAAIRERALNAGAREFLHKPFEAETMLQALSDAIGA
jgi:CheY-like chemotaxis protein